MLHLFIELSNPQSSFCVLCFLTGGKKKNFCIFFPSSLLFSPQKANEHKITGILCIQGAEFGEENTGRTTQKNRKMHHRGNVLSNVFPSAVYSYLMFQHCCLENRLNVVLFREVVFTGRRKLVLQPSVNLSGWVDSRHYSNKILVFICLSTFHEYSVLKQFIPSLEYEIILVFCLTPESFSPIPV